VACVVLALAGAELALHVPCYVVAHFPYTMSMGALFGIYAAFYFWIGKMSGRQYNETLGKIHFWITFIGVNIIFFPQHFLGLAGMPRRIPDYNEVYTGFNMVSSIGAYISAVGTVLFIYIAIRTITSGEKCPDTPWGDGADPREWTLPSPPPFHQFEELPRIR
ncbi:MAG: cbb3-type cytochrome c oxidase subunit I, partial [Alphaproteobacteria bacterium]|nr:cbb3-type cytochrome c oxidase subunit I [Alphaproteobacteria bacterium]